MKKTFNLGVIFDDSDSDDNLFDEDDDELFLSNEIEEAMDINDTSLVDCGLFICGYVLTWKINKNYMI